MPPLLCYILDGDLTTFIILYRNIKSRKNPNENNRRKKYDQETVKYSSCGSYGDDLCHPLPWLCPLT